jgi:eukaryotic-like serine/threonine-protein kinase
MAVLCSSLTGQTQELRCGPMVRGRSSADGTHCECVAPMFEERVVDFVRRCVPQLPVRDAQGRRGAPPGAPRSCPLNMSLIPAGTFWMGSPDGLGAADEHPQRQVRVAAFCMDRIEVTVSSYDRCVSAGVCSPRSGGWSRGRPDLPATGVSWNDADAFCRWRGGRLPTEMEWEYGARGTDGRMFPWGNEAPWRQLCWSRGDGGPCVVGRFGRGASPFGLFDMAGNVWEWTGSWYASSDQGPTDEAFRVCRGGAWGSSDPSWVRVALRVRIAPTSRDNNLGFRCAGALR